MKTIEQNFIDWESQVFGFGYGTGEDHTLPALKKFFALIGADPECPRGYHYETLEKELTPTVAWLLINTLCHADVIEYGTSPRGGWLTTKGEALKAFIDGKSADELIALVCERDENYIGCMPDYCNCDPPTRGDRAKGCANPFWTEDEVARG